jgi:hypothetical protein
VRNDNCPRDQDTIFLSKIFFESILHEYTLVHQKRSHQAQDQTLKLSKYLLPRRQCDPAVSFPMRRVEVLLSVGSALNELEIRHQELEENSRNANRTTFPLGRIPTMLKYSLNRHVAETSQASPALQLCSFAVAT